MSKKKRCCGTCALSLWELTPTGRRARNKSGWCMFDMLKHTEKYNQTLPICGTSASPRKSAIWPEDGNDCPQYVEADK